MRSQAILALLSLGLAVTADCARAESVGLITTSTTWRYNKSGTNLGTTWTRRDYDETAAGWEGPGTMLFGFETTPSEYAPFTFNTVFPDPTTQAPFVTNYYFRTHFAVDDAISTALGGTKLITTNVVDDGAVAYLNGVEIFRFNMPAGPMTATTFASASLGEGWLPGQTVFVSTNLGTNLVVGDNVLAVEVHQAGAGSSDVVFGMTLTAIPPIPLVITNQPASQSNLIGSTVTLSIGVSGTDPVYRWYSNNVPVADGTLSSYAVPTRASLAADYSAVVTNVLGSVTSKVVRVLILPDTFPITMLLALAGNSPESGSRSNRVIVFFDKRVVGTSAIDSANYNISILGTTNTVPVLQARFGAPADKVALDGPTNFTFAYGSNYILTVNNVSGTNGLPIQPNSQIGISIARTNPLPPFTSLIAMAQRWDFNESAMDLGGDWMKPEYIEGLDWGFGNGIFYFDANGGFAGTCAGGPESALCQGLTTYYFRTTFVAPQNTPGSGLLRLRYLLDDGAVFYLNGTEILRVNMPATGPVAYNTRASTSIGAPFCASNLIAFDNLLFPRTNSMAVELHEGLGGLMEADAYFGMSLEFATNYSPITTNTSPLPPRLRIVPDSTTTAAVTWSNTAEQVWTLEFATNATPAAVWMPLPGSSPYTNAFTPGQRFFRARVQ